MSKKIQRLGITKSGLNYLDKFRQLITQIGNALGYVRMIRGASLKDNSNLIKYIPTFIESIKFEAVAGDLGIQGETLESIKLFDMCIKNLFKQADEAGDYLRLIVKNFEGLNKQDNTKHLKLFYLLIPPLTMSYIDHLQRGNERIQSKNKNIGGFIFDDGFVMGIAYVLKILNQVEKFNSLNWFESQLSKLKLDMQHNEMRQSHLMKESFTYTEDSKVDAELSKRRIAKL